MDTRAFRLEFNVELKEMMDTRTVILELNVYWKGLFRHKDFKSIFRCVMGMLETITGRLRVVSWEEM